MEKELELSNTFPNVSKAQWTEKVMEDLKGAEFKKLIWHTYEGVEVQPFYTKEDITGLTLVSNHLTQREWANYSEILVQNAEQANAEAQKMLKLDVNGFLFQLENPETINFETLLKGLAPDKLQISFKTDIPDVKVVKQYFGYCESQGISLKSISGFYESDILETWITIGTKPDFAPYEHLIWETLKAPNFYGISIKSHAFADSGANLSQEMAFSLNKAVEFVSSLASKELPPKVILDEIMLHMAVGGDYFFEIAKLRALRTLFRSIAQSYEVEAPDVKILSSSNLWSKSLFDPYVNMLRNTTEAMSAILGGCDALLIQPHDSSYKQPTDFSRRIAVNVSNLLREEAYFNKVVDPAGGAYYIENLTSKLANKTLQLFKEIESKGGFFKAFEAGVISKAIKTVREQKMEDFASRKLIAVGTNKYANLQEKVDFGETEISEDKLLLKPQRSTQAFNQLRLKTQKHFEETGFIPKVYLACFGNLAMGKVRATFSAEFFGPAGFRLLGEFPFAEATRAAEEAASSEADIVVMCSSDPDYESSAEAFSKAFKAKAPDKLLVLAGYPADLVEKLKTAGVDTFIHIKTNALEALSGFQDKLFIAPKTA